MVRSSYSDVFEISHERELDEQILAGDLVRTGANAFPHYRVIAVYGDKVWVRDVVFSASVRYEDVRYADDQNTLVLPPSTVASV